MDEGIFGKDAQYSKFFPSYKRFLSLPLLVQLLILGQLCQIESENNILHKFIDMITENFNVELRKVIT